MERQNSSLITIRFPALASRDYVLFVTGQLISVIGTWMQATALPYLAYRMTGREALQSAIALQRTAFNVGRVLGPLCAAFPPLPGASSQK